MLQNILWFVAVVVIIGAIFSLFRGLLKWGIILLIVALLFGGLGFFA
ncbi:MAG: GPGG-motif small membrane protein [Actinomycetota bacterium]|nr:GPGG-motif small membrane protein [Actinomycetota bacterium]